MTAARWVAFIARYRRAILFTSLLGCLVSAWSITRLRLDMDVLTMLPQGKPAFDNFKLFVEHFGELDELVILLHGAPPPALRDFADRLAAALGQLDSVTRVQARVDADEIMRGVLGRYLYNYLPDAAYDDLQRKLTPDGIAAQLRANRAILNAPLDVSAGERMSQDPFGVRQQAAGALLQSLGGGGGGGDGYLASRDNTALLLLVRPTTTPFDIIFTERFMAEVRAAEAAVRRASGNTVQVEYTGGYIYALEDKATLERDVAQYAFLALVAVLLTFLAGYRNLRILPFVTYPLIVTTLIDFSLSLLIFDQLNAVSLAFAAILYGLSIDTAIHFYTRLVHERQQRPLPDAVAVTLAALARATVTAALTTAAVFAVIGLSVLPAVQQLGIMTAVGMIINIGVFFLLYPALGLSMTNPVRLGALTTPRLARIAGASARYPHAVLLTTAVVVIACVMLASRVQLDATLTHLRPRQSHAIAVQERIAALFGRRDTGGAVLIARPTADAALRDGEAIAARLDGYQAEGLVSAVRSVRGLLPSADVQRARLARYAALPRAQAAEQLRAALPQHGFAAEPFRGFLEELVEPRAALIAPGDEALAPLQSAIDRYLRARPDGYYIAVYVEPAPGTSFDALAARLRRDAGSLLPIIASGAQLESELERMLRRELVLFLVLAVVLNLLLLWRAGNSLALAPVLMLPAALGVLLVFAGMAAVGIALDPVNLIVLPLILGIGVDDAVYLYAGVRRGLPIDAAMNESGRALVMTSYTEIAGFGCLALSQSPALATMGLLAAVGLLVSLAATILVLPAALKAASA